MKTENRESFALAFLKYILPPILLITAILGAIIIIKSKAKPTEVELVRLIPDVEVFEAKSEAVKLDVSSQGSVTPRIATLLISEVSGVVEWVSPALYAGGFFEKGNLLMRIEPTEYIAAVASAKSLVAQMTLHYEQELALSTQAKKDWDDMGEGDPTNLVLRIPQLEKAKADIEYAKASLEVAKRNLSYTEVKAPYDGRVKEKFVDIGQSVSPKATQLATIYSVDSVEVRLSLNSNDASFINLPELYENESEVISKPSVEIIADYAGNTYSWMGYLDRTEGVIDPRTRLIYVVAKVDDPYAKEEGSEKPPLKVGMFVKAIIEGRTLPNGFVIPNGGLNPGNLVYTLDEENRLVIKKVKVAKQGSESVVIEAGLEHGDRVVLTPLQSVVEGMQLQAVPHES